MQEQRDDDERHHQPDERPVAGGGRQRAVRAPEQAPQRGEREGERQEERGPGEGDAEVHRHADGRRAVFDLELRQDVLDVHLRGFFTDREGGGDLLVSHPLRDELEHLHFSRRQMLSRRALGQTRFEQRVDVGNGDGRGKKNAGVLACLV